MIFGCSMGVSRQTCGKKCSHPQSRLIQLRLCPHIPWNVFLKTENFSPNTAAVHMFFGIRENVSTVKIYDSKTLLVDAYCLYAGGKYPFSKISGYVWTRPRQINL